MGASIISVSGWPQHTARYSFPKLPCNLAAAYCVLAASTQPEVSLSRRFTGLKVSEALAVEDKNSEAAQTFANLLVVKEGNEQNEGVQALLKALQTDAVKEFINKTYDGSVVAIF